MEIKYINILSILYFTIVFILQLTFILINYQQMNLEIIPLVLTNYMMILPIKKLVNKISNDRLLIIDLIASFGIHFFSSFYHMCDFSFVNRFCLIEPIKWKYLDYYFSYLMVGLGVQHLLFENIPIKILFYFLSVFIQGVMIYLDFRNVLLNLSISFVKLGFIIFYNLFNKDKLIKQSTSLENLKNNTIENLEFYNVGCLYYQKNVNYSFNVYYLLFNLLCIFIACLGRFYFTESKYYWWAHSFCWHIFIFSSCYFNYSMLDYNIKIFFRWNEIKKRINGSNLELEII
jgi:hypothetical protein